MGGYFTRHIKDMKAKLTNGQVIEYNNLPTSYNINGLKVNLRSLSEISIKGQGFYDVLVPTLGADEVLEPLIESDFSNELWTKRKRSLTAQEITERDENISQSDKEQLINAGFDVAVQGKNINFSRAELNDFITMKNESSLAGLTEVEWLADDGTWVVMTIAEATMVGLNAMQQLQTIYKTN